MQEGTEDADAAFLVMYLKNDTIITATSDTGTVTLWKVALLSQIVCLGSKLTLPPVNLNEKECQKKLVSQVNAYFIAYMICVDLTLCVT